MPCLLSATRLLLRLLERLGGFLLFRGLSLLSLIVRVFLLALMSVLMSKLLGEKVFMERCNKIGSADY